MFDPDGVELTLAEPSADRAAIERLTKGGSEVVVAECGTGLQWLRGADAREAWVRRQRDFEDVSDWTPPPDAPGALPYRGEIWRRSDQHIVVLVND